MESRQQTPSHYRYLLVVLATATNLFFSSSCSPILSQRPTESVAIDIPSTFAAAQKGENKAITQGWLASLRDPILTKIVRSALTNNLDLQGAAIRLRSAREGTIIGRAARLPDLTTSSNNSLTRTNTDTFESFGLSLNSSWEADVWGRLRDLENASIADYEAAVADFRSARLSLAVNTAQAYCNLITAENQLTLARETLDSFQKNYQIIQRGYKLGTLRPLDDAFGRSNIASAKASLESSQLNRQEAARTLQLLLGEYPDTLIKSAPELPRIPEIRAGIPSDLIERRPDLTASRLQIYVSAKQADAARKNLLPSFRLTANTGSSSSELRDLLDPSNLVSTIAGSITQRIFAGGELNARARQAFAANESDVRIYQQDVLQALREVESALDANQSLKEQEQHLLTEVENTALAEKWAESDFVEGLDVGNRPSILEVLEAQRRALNARSSLISLRNNRLQNHLDLLLALGGTF